MADAPYSFAYQPIVDIRRREIESFEALVRGEKGESARSVLQRYDAQGLRQFDMDARMRAITLATQLGLTCRLNLNVLPDAIDAAGAVALSSTVEMASLAGLDASQLVLEVSEREAISDIPTFLKRSHQCRALGVQFAVDDFGSGHSGLNLLAEFQPDSIKLDMALIREVHCRGPRQAIVRGVLRTCEDLGIDVVAEGVETLDEYHWLREEGVYLFQGYLFAAPELGKLPTVRWPDVS